MKKSMCVKTRKKITSSYWRDLLQTHQFSETNPRNKIDIKIMNSSEVRNPSSQSKAYSLMIEIILQSLIDISIIWQPKYSIIEEEILCNLN
jgi:hypothetical protein